LTLIDAFAGFKSDGDWTKKNKQKVIVRRNIRENLLDGGGIKHTRELSTRGDPVTQKS
jgi:hypothetical protein